MQAYIDTATKHTRDRISYPTRYIWHLFVSHMDAHQAQNTSGSQVLNISGSLMESKQQHCYCWSSQYHACKTTSDIFLSMLPAYSLLPAVNQCKVHTNGLIPQIARCHCGAVNHQKTKWTPPNLTTLSGLPAITPACYLPSSFQQHD